MHVFDTELDVVWSVWITIINVTEWIVLIHYRPPISFSIINGDVNSACVCEEKHPETSFAALMNAVPSDRDPRVSAGFKLHFVK